MLFLAFHCASTINNSMQCCTIVQRGLRQGLSPLTHSFSHLSLASVTMPCMRCSMRLLSDCSLCSCCCRVSSSCWSDRLSCSYMFVVFCSMSTWRVRQRSVGAKRKTRENGGKWSESVPCILTFWISSPVSPVPPSGCWWLCLFRSVCSAGRGGRSPLNSSDRPAAEAST